jgi:inosine-uridine nucleoside N-ribohydrolase
LDVDTGIDDALALIYAVRSPDLDLVGVTTCFGNGDIHTTTRNTLAVLELAGADVPVHQGADRPWVGEWHASAEAFHGANGLGEAPVPDPRRGPASREAAVFLTEAARQHQGSLVIVATARLTNLAAALTLEPRLAAWVKRLVVMGGAAFVPGNVTAAAEANIWGDPEAAWRVLHCDAPLLREAVEFYMRAYNPNLQPGQRSCPLHDPLAVALAEDPSLAEYEMLPVDVELHGTLTRGATIVDARPYRTAPPNAAVALRLRPEAFRRRFLEQIGVAGS